MGTVDAAGGNAIESLSALLLKNVLDRHPATREDPRTAFTTRIGRTRHRRRRRLRLNRSARTDFETIVKRHRPSAA